MLYPVYNDRGLDVKRTFLLFFHPVKNKSMQANDDDDDDYGVPTCLVSNSIWVHTKYSRLATVHAIAYHTVQSLVIVEYYDPSNYPMFLELQEFLLQYRLYNPDEV